MTPRTLCSTKTSVRVSHASPTRGATPKKNKKKLMKKGRCFFFFFFFFFFFACGEPYPPSSLSQPPH